MWRLALLGLIDAQIAEIILLFVQTNARVFFAEPSGKHHNLEFKYGLIIKCTNRVLLGLVSRTGWKVSPYVRGNLAAYRRAASSGSSAR
jgi:hypothetical protein